MQINITRTASPLDTELALDPTEGTTEAMVRRTVDLDGATRVELELSDGTAARADITEFQAQSLELADGDIIYVRATVAAHAA